MDVDLERSDLEELEKDVRWLFNKIPALGPFMISYLTGVEETGSYGGNMIDFLEDFNYALSLALDITGEENIDDWIDWKMYQAITKEKDNENIFVSLSHSKIKKIFQRGKELEKEYGPSGPPIPSAENRQVRLGDLADYINVLNRAFETRYVHAYILLGALINEKKVREERVRSLQRDLSRLEEMGERVKSLYSSLEKLSEHAEEIESRFLLDDWIKGKTDEVARGEISLRDYLDYLSMRGKIISVAIGRQGIKVGVDLPENYPTWDDFGGYHSIKRNVQSWIRSADRNMVKRVLLAGPPGTGKTLLMRIAAREFAQRGYAVVYLERLAGATVESLESLCKLVERSFGVNVAALADDLEHILEVDTLNRNATLDQIEKFRYPLIMTANPDVIVRNDSYPDMAALRRFDLVRYFHVPSPSERKEIARIIYRNINRSAGGSTPIRREDLDRIVKLSEGQPGAYMELLMKRYCSYEGEISWEEVNRELKNDLEGVARGLPAGSSRNIYI